MLGAPGLGLSAFFLATAGLAGLSACREEPKVCSLDKATKGDQLKPLEDPACEGKAAPPA